MALATGESLGTIRRKFPRGIGIAVVVGSFHMILRIFKWLCLVLLVYVLVAFFAHASWTEAGLGLIGPRAQLGFAFLGLVVGVGWPVRWTIQYVRQPRRTAGFASDLSPDLHPHVCHRRRHTAPPLSKPARLTGLLVCMLIAVVLAGLAALSITPLLDGLVPAGPQAAWTPQIWVFLLVRSVAHFGDGVAGWLI
jgi:hypothetical protein